MQKRHETYHNNNPMFELICELMGVFFKLLTKFSVPRSKEMVDYRCLKSALCVGGLLEMYAFQILEA